LVAEPDLHTPDVDAAAAAQAVPLEHCSRASARSIENILAINGVRERRRNCRDRSLPDGRSAWSSIAFGGRARFAHA
jgi:hypothetical protein